MLPTYCDEKYSFLFFISYCDYVSLSSPHSDLHLRGRGSRWQSGHLFLRCLATDFPLLLELKKNLSIEVQDNKKVTFDSLDLTHMCVRRWRHCWHSLRSRFPWWRCKVSPVSETRRRTRYVQQRRSCSAARCGCSWSEPRNGPNLLLHDASKPERTTQEKENYEYQYVWRRERLQIQHLLTSTQSYWI